MQEAFNNRVNDMGLVRYRCICFSLLLKSILCPRSVPLWWVPEATTTNCVFRALPSPVVLMPLPPNRRPLTLKSLHPVISGRDP